MWLIKSSLAIAVSIGIVFSSIPNVYADETSKLILKLLIKKGIITQKEIDEIEAEIAKEKEEKPPIAKIAEALVPGYAKQGKIKFKGYVQARYTYNEEGNDTFRVPNAYLVAYGEVLPGWEYEVEANVAGSAPHLRNGYIRWSQFAPEMKLTLGQFKPQFAQEFLTSSSMIDTVNRSLAVTNLSRERDIGVMLDGKLFKGRVTYGAGIFNGTDINTNDNNDNKDFTGRIVLSPFKGYGNFLQGLSFGTAAWIGKQPRSGIYAGDRNAYEGLAIYKYDKLKLQGEYIFREYDLVAGKDREADGFYTLATYDIPTDQWDWMWMIQPVFKYEQYDPNRHASNDRQDIYTVGGNLFFNKYTKLMLNYRFLEEETEDSNNDFLAQFQVKF